MSARRRVVPKARRFRGIVEIALGIALVIAGLIMCVIPGPGIATIVCGVAMACRGQRNFAGRVASKAEYKLDKTIAQFMAMARREVPKTVRSVGQVVFGIFGKLSHALSGALANIEAAIRTRIGKAHVRVDYQTVRHRAS